MENVYGLAYRNKNQKVFQRFLAGAAAAGYATDYKILLAADYGRYNSDSACSAWVSVATSGFVQACCRSAGLSPHTRGLTRPVRPGTKRFLCTQPLAKR